MAKDIIVKEPTTEKLSKGITGIAGEYFAAAELSRRNFMASITLRNNDSIDILASNPRNNKIYSIQVKTSQSNSRSWPLSSKSETNFSEHHFYIFINFRSIFERPEYFIVPSKIVSEAIKLDHQTWLQKPGRNGHIHKDNSLRKFYDIDEAYLEKWEFLEF